MKYKYLWPNYGYSVKRTMYFKMKGFVMDFWVAFLNTKIESQD